MPWNLRRRSPIEIMIDAACSYQAGVAPENASRPQPLAATCPSCGYKGQFGRDKSDPPGAVSVEILCRDCMMKHPEIKMLSAVFRDADGARIE